MGTVEGIYIAGEPRAMPDPVERANALAGQGLEGDYHCEPHDRAGADLTLIAAEALEALAEEYGVVLEPGESRRNITTRGIDLNALVGRRFSVGEVQAVGVELCEPCMVLVRLTDQFPVLRGLAHRGGLRADVVEGVRIALGDAIRDGGPADSDC